MQADLLRADHTSIAGCVAFSIAMGFPIFVRVWHFGKQSNFTTSNTVRTLGFWKGDALVAAMKEQFLGASVVRCERGKVDVDLVLGVDSFSLGKALEVRVATFTHSVGLLCSISNRLALNDTL